MSFDRSPALTIRFPSSADAAARDHLVAFLADYDLIAIQEDDVAMPRVWTAHFASTAARDAAADAMAALPGTAALEIERAEIEDEDWARRTQADLPAIRIGRIVVAPPWDLPPRDSREASPSTAPLLVRFGSASQPQSPPDVVVEIEPSRGFGTGHHQSTRLCLALLQNRDLEKRIMIDVGTGSGVLAIVAAKLGAAFVSAIDIDPESIENARENIARNGVGAVVEAHVRDVDECSLPPADLVTANLTGTLLARHAGSLGALVGPTGNLIAAGFTVDEREMVLEAFQAELDLSESAEEDDWVGFVLTKRARI